MNVKPFFVRTFDVSSSASTGKLQTRPKELSLPGGRAYDTPEGTKLRRCARCTVSRIPITMFAQERLKAISKVVRERRRMTFAELQAVISASPATIQKGFGRARRIRRAHSGSWRRDGYTLCEVGDHLRRAHASQRSCQEGDRRTCRSPDSVWSERAHRRGNDLPRGGEGALREEDARIIAHSVTLVEAARQGEAELLCVGGELRKVSGALTGGEPWAFSPAFAQISPSLARPDWLPKKAARTRSFSRPK